MNRLNLIIKYLFVLDKHLKYIDQLLKEQDLFSNKVHNHFFGHIKNILRLYIYLIPDNPGGATKIIWLYRTLVITEFRRKSIYLMKSVIST